MKVTHPTEAELDVLRCIAGGDALSSFGKIPRGQSVPVFSEFFLKGDDDQQPTPVSVDLVSSLVSAGYLRRRDGLPEEIAQYKLTEQGVSAITKADDVPGEWPIPELPDVLVAVMGMLKPLESDQRRRVLRACLELET